MDKQCEKWRPKRPLAVYGAVYLTALAVFFKLGTSPCLSAAVGIGTFLLICALAVCPGFPVRRSFLFGTAAFLALAFCLTQITLADFRTFQTQEQRAVTLSGTVRSLSYAGDSGAAFVLDVDSMDGTDVSGCVRVQSSGTAYYAEPGETVCISAILGEETLLSNYERYRVYDFADRIYAYAYIAEETEEEAVFRVTGKAHGILRLCHTLTDHCQRQLYRFLDADAAALTTGILLGDTGDLSPAVLRDFRRIGFSHVLAVSGIHLSVLLGGMQRLLQKTDRRLRLFCMLGFLLLFMGMTGFTPSILRAGIMWMLVTTASCTGDRADGISSLLGAACIICILTPTAIADIGFLLSCSATLGILVLSPPTEVFLSRLPQSYGIVRIAKRMLSQCGITFAATVFTLPICLFVFGEISSLSVIANCLMNPFVTLLLYLTPVCLLVSLLPFSVPAAFLGGCISGLCTLITDIGAWISAFPFALVGVRYPFLLPLFLLFCAVMLGGLLYFRKHKHVLLMVYPLYAAFCLLFVLCSGVYTFLYRSCVFMDVSVYKQNDIVTVVSAGKGLYIDASDGTLTSARQGIRQLSEQNMTQVDAILYTHLHAKHAVTLAKLSRETVIRTVLLPTAENAEEEAIIARIRAAAQAAEPPVSVLTYTRGIDTLVIGNAEIRTLAPAYLERSVQPLFGYTMTECAGEDKPTVCMLSSAAYDPDAPSSFAAQRDAMVSQADILCFGTHGPHIKHAFDAGIDDNISCLLLADEEVRAFCKDTVLFHADTVYVTDRRECIRLILD